MAQHRTMSPLRRAQIKAALVFLLPVCALLLASAAWPLLRTLMLGLTDTSLYVIEGANWVGFDNFLYFLDGEAFGILSDPRWWLSVRNTLIFAFTSVALELVLGMAIAVTLNQPIPMRAGLRAALLIPWAIPTIVTAQIWLWMLHDQYGVLNHIFEMLGLIERGVPWLSQPSTALASIILIDVWKTTPFMALMILAALQVVPKDLLDAARMDGANPVQSFFRVTLPVIFPAVAVAIVFRLLDALRVFDLIYIINPSDENIMSMSVYARRLLFEFGRFGAGSAASILLFIVVSALAITWIKLSRATDQAQ